MGSFDIDELQDIKLQFGRSIERDTSFKPEEAYKIFEKLRKGEHV